MVAMAADSATLAPLVESAALALGGERRAGLDG